MFNNINVSVGLWHKYCSLRSLDVFSCLVGRFITYPLVLCSPGHVNGVNVIGLTLQGPSVPIAIMKPANLNQPGKYIGISSWKYCGNSEIMTNLIKLYRWHFQRAFVMGLTYKGFCL